MIVNDPVNLDKRIKQIVGPAGCGAAGSVNIVPGVADAPMGPAFEPKPAKTTVVLRKQISPNC
jgi:hypothetical protein